jgi:hypothetical protein
MVPHINLHFHAGLPEGHDRHAPFQQTEQADTPQAQKTAA